MHKGLIKFQLHIRATECSDGVSIVERYPQRLSPTDVVIVNVCSHLQHLCCGPSWLCMCVCVCLRACV